MMKLTGCNRFDIQGLRSIKAFLPPPVHSRGVRVEEPIQVHVHVRRHADEVLEARRVPSAKPDAGRLPVGSMLDCYL